jgi:cysteinyl-tRNA synthetase
LNVPKAIGVLHSYGSPKLWRHFDAVLGLDFETHAVQPAEVAVPADVLALVDERQAARKAKDFARSDAIRAELLSMGWEVGDSPQGPTIKPVG